MRYILKSILVLFFYLSAILFAQAQESKRSSIIETIDGKKYYIHLTQPGESLSDLQRVYDVTAEEIVRATPSLEKDESIRSNQIVRIPVTSAQPSKSGKDISGLSRQPEKPADSLKSKPLKKQVNRKVQDKNKPSGSRKMAYHTVEKGETLFSISQRYKLTVAQLSNVNPGLGLDLKIGQKIAVPVYLAEKKKRAPDIPNSGIFKGSKFNAYTVKQGETVYRIAKNFGISQKEVLRMNPGLEVTNLAPGARIRIPVDSKGAAPNSGKDEMGEPVKHTQSENFEQTDSHQEQDTIKTYRYYKVKFLERIPGIAKRQNINIDTIYKLNPGIREEGVGWGDVIKLPRSAEIQTAVYEEKTPGELPTDTTINYIVHKVQRKETLYRIAKLYDVSQQEIVKLNPGADKQIQKGQKLKIPVKKPELAEKKEPEEEEVKEVDLFKEACMEKSGLGSHFRIALMVPLYLEEYQKIDTSGLMNSRPNNLKSMNFIQFYEGAMVALDSLKAQGIDTDVMVYDIGKSRQDAITGIDSRLSTADLIIGPIYNEPFQVMNRFANEHDIKIVNPLSSRNSIIRQKKDVYKVQASNAAEFNTMAEYLKNHYSDTTKIYVVRDSRYQQKENLRYLTNSLEQDSLRESSKSSHIVDIHYSQDSLNPILKDVDSLKGHKVVVALTHNNVFTIELLRHLNEARDSIGTISVFGRSEWRNYNLNSEYLMNLDVHLFDDQYIDYDSPEVKWFLKRFREKYFTEPLPEKYAFVGFDVMFYFGTALLNFGENFDNCLRYHHPQTLETRIRFRENEWGSYENDIAVPLRYYNYKLIKMPN